jgi:hypothetical protein
MVLLATGVGLNEPLNVAFTCDDVGSYVFAVAFDGTVVLRLGPPLSFFGQKIDNDSFQVYTKRIE